MSNNMNRRRFIGNTTLAMGALAGAFEQGVVESCASAAERPTPEAGESDNSELIDTHVYLSRWPYRRMPRDDTEQLVKKLREYGVTSAWVGSFDALLHQDIGAVNVRLAEECAAQREIRFLPFGAVNPTLPDWEEDLRRCREVHRMPGLRVHPDFHGYALNDPRFERLVDLATRCRMIVQIGLGMEDPRLQHPLAKVPPVNPEPLIEMLPRYPEARIVLLNFWRSFRTIRGLQARLNRLPQVSFDMATIESVAGIESLLQSEDSLRLLFGSYAPFYNFGSSWRKLYESILTPEQLDAIRCGQARQILEPA